MPGRIRNIQSGIIPFIPRVMQGSVRLSPSTIWWDEKVLSTGTQLRNLRDTSVLLQSVQNWWDGWFSVTKLLSISQLSFLVGFGMKQYIQKNWLQRANEPNVEQIPKWSFSFLHWDFDEESLQFFKRDQRNVWNLQTCLKLTHSSHISKDLLPRPRHGRSKRDKELRTLKLMNLESI